MWSVTDSITLSYWRQKTMIEISGLTESDKGRAVTYIPFIEAPKSLHEYGYISGWNDRYIFVGYGKGLPPSIATHPAALFFDKEEDDDV